MQRHSVDTTTFSERKTASTASCPAELIRHAKSSRRTPSAQLLRAMEDASGVGDARLSTGTLDADARKQVRAEHQVSERVARAREANSERQASIDQGLLPPAPAISPTSEPLPGLVPDPSVYDSSPGNSADLTPGRARDASDSSATSREASKSTGREASTSKDDARRESKRESRRDRLTALDVTLHELLGKGSYGMVYRASTTRLGLGDVAVKVLPWAPNEVSSELKKELKLLQRCDSPYIVRAHGSFPKPKELWIVIEYCDLGSVLDTMRSIGQPLDEGAIAQVCRDALCGLLHLHTQKRVVIHRDVKAANILLTSAATVKLADFGVAAQLNSTASKRSSVIGTPHWMAPEVISNGKYDARADVWSLGITAIEMAQMRPPHHDMRPVLKVLFAIASGEPPGLENPDGFSPTFTAFIAHALTKDATERPTSAALLKHDFLQAARRDSLVPLIEKAQHFKANPRPKHRVSDASTATNASGTLRASGRTSIDDGSTIGGTFCAAGDTGTAEGTFCACSTADGGGGGGTLVGGWGGAFAGDRESNAYDAGGTLVSGGTADGGTFVNHGTSSDIGGTFVNHGTASEMGGTFVQHGTASDMGGTFVQHGTFGGGGTFVQHDTLDAATAAAALAGCASCAAAAPPEAPSHAPPIPRSPMAGGARPASGGSGGFSSGGRSGGGGFGGHSGRSEDEELYHTVKEGAADDFDLQRALSLARGAEAREEADGFMEGDSEFGSTLGSPGPRVIPRAASDDALFERAVSTFREKGGTFGAASASPSGFGAARKPIPRCRTEGDALRMAMAEGYDVNDVEHGGAGCVVS